MCERNSARHSVFFKRWVWQFVFEDLGTNSAENVDYPDYANELARKIGLNNNIKGVLICGT